jgi:hypothetical protein
MTVKSEDILKPGAVLKVEKIDFNDPDVIAIVKASREACKRLRRRWTQEDYDTLRKVITI